MIVCPICFKLFYMIFNISILDEVYRLSKVTKGQQSPLVVWQTSRSKLCFCIPSTDRWLVRDLHHPNTSGAQVLTSVWYYSPPLQAVFCGFPRNPDFLQTFRRSGTFIDGPGLLIYVICKDLNHFIHTIAFT